MQSNINGCCRSSLRLLQTSNRKKPFTGNCSIECFFYDQVSIKLNIHIFVALAFH